MSNILNFKFFDNQKNNSAPNPEYEAQLAFEKEAGLSQIEAISDVLREVPPGIKSYRLAPITTSRPNPMWFVWGDTDKAGAARLARALFKGRIPMTKRRYDTPGIYSSILFIGLSDGTVAKFIAPEGLGGKTARTLTASDRSALIRLASSLPSGSTEKRAILAGLRGSSKAWF